MASRAAARPDRRRPTGSGDPVDRVLAALEDGGVLMVQDQSLPSVVGILTGETPRGSWWSHPKGRLIFTTLGLLADREDVLFTKLLDAKQTLVHRRLWPHVLAVGSSSEPWQTKGISAAARRLRARVESGEEPVRASGVAAKELEWRLLAVARQVHTESGRHETMLESWRGWASRVGCKPTASVSAASKFLERATFALGAPPEALPWRD